MEVGVRKAERLAEIIESLRRELSPTPAEVDRERCLAVLARLEDELGRQAAATAEGGSDHESFCRTLVEASPSPIGVVQDGSFVFMNPAFARLLGLECSSAVPRPVAEVVHPRQHELVRQRLTRTSEGLANPPVELTLVRRDGSEVEAETMSAPMSFEGRPAALVVGLDITERKRAELALRKSQRRSQELYSLMRMMCDNVPDMIWAKDLNGAFTFVNRAMATVVLGARDTDEPIGKTDAYFAARERGAHPENPEWHTFGENCQASDEVIAATRFAERFDECGTVVGRPIHLDVYKAPFFDERGQLVGTVGCARDVTHERRLEEERRLADEAYRTLVDHSPYGFLIWQEERPVFVNPAVCALTGYCAEELLAMSEREVQALVHPDDRETAFALPSRVLRGEAESPEVEVRLHTRGGEERWVRAHALVGDYRGVRSIQIVVVDITERKLAAERLRASLAEKEVLLRELHHRVKNNLHAIMALIDMQADGLDERSVRSIADLHGRVASMALVHESLYQAEDLTSIAFDAYLDRLLDRLIHAMGGQTAVDVHLTVPPLRLPIDAAISCGLIVNELVTNAFKHAFPEGLAPRSESGEGCTLSVEMALDDGEVRLCVADNGIGLPPGLDWRTTDTLGLRVVNMLASQHLGGEVAHTNQGGSRFVIRFPEPRDASVH